MRVAGVAGVAGVAAIGPATAEALRARGIEPDLVATESHGLGLAAALLPHLKSGDRVLLPQASDARTELAEALRAHGVEVVTVVAYKKRSVQVSDERRREIVETLSSPSGAWVTFTSPRTVHELRKLLGAEWPSLSQVLRAASIGPTTSAALRAQGIEPAVVAAVASEDGLIEAIVRASS